MRRMWQSWFQEAQAPASINVSGQAGSGSSGSTGGFGAGSGGRADVIANAVEVAAAAPMGKESLSVTAGSAYSVIVGQGGGGGGRTKRRLREAVRAVI